MKKTVTTFKYWEERYQNQNTPWDIGYASPPLIHYLEKLEDHGLRILLPGAGRAYEAVWLHEQGFTEVYVCDWAPSAFDYLRSEAPGFPDEHMLVRDFFDLEQRFDLMLEQTFFSALRPEDRQAYADKAQYLLQPNGKLAGVLFAHTFEGEGPPFGGTAEEYQQLFAGRFDILNLHIAADSIGPRQGRELFIELQARPVQ